jgi:hypothetical protein
LARVTISTPSRDLGLKPGDEIPLFVQLSRLHGKQVLAHLPKEGWQIGKWVGG